VKSEVQKSPIRATTLDRNFGRIAHFVVAKNVFRTITELSIWLENASNPPMYQCNKGKKRYRKANHKRASQVADKTQGHGSP